MELKRLFLALSLSLLTGLTYAKTTVDKVATTTESSRLVPTKRESFPKLAPELDFARSTVLVSMILTQFEYDKKPLTVAMGEKVYDNYFKMLDPQKMYFIAEDIEYFSSAKPVMSKMIREGNLRFAFDVYKLYRERVADRLDYVLSLLDKPFDFSVDEEFNVDRKKAEWAKNNDEANDLWRKRVKNDFLRLKLNKTDDTKIREILRKRYINNHNQVVRMNSEDVAEMFLNAYADSTDPHTNYYSPTSAKNFDVQLSLSVEGIGAVLQKRDEYGQIREVVAGGPAARSGELQPGDRIVAVGQGDNGPMEDVIDWRLDDIVKKIRGKRGSVVRIEVIPADSGLDGKHKTIRIVREKVTMEDQAARSKVIETNVDDIKRKIGIITVPSFYEDFEGRSNGNKNYKSVTRDVKKILDTFNQEGVEAVVLDLRENGGGSLNEAANLSGLFLGNNQNIVQIRSAEGSISGVRSRGVEQVWKKPVVVIINRISASASEIFAAAIQDYARGIVVGGDTWGKGTVQTFRPLADFLRFPDEDDNKLGALKWTIQKFFRVNGSSTQVKGVSPDIEFPSVFVNEELGESSYDNAMPWTEIPAAKYQPFTTKLKATITQLSKKHQARVEQSASWQLFKDETEYRLKEAKRKSFSLNLAKREAEFVATDRIYKEFEQRRKELGEDDASKLEMDDGLAMGEGNLKKELEDAKKRRESIDTVAKEAANIASDLVTLSKK